MTPRILFIDAYDSFANNIVDCIVRQVQAHVEIIRIDDDRFLNQPTDLFVRFLATYDAVVAGPGPGDPRSSQDVGLFSRLWQLDGHQLLPVLGICLGFQSLAVAHAASVNRLPDPRHGNVAEIKHNGRSFYQGIGPVHATLYNSLEVLLDSTPAQCELRPLAWTTNHADKRPTLMAIEHVSKPFWGVQYHPESVCTSSNGSGIFKAWWKLAASWLQREDRVCQISIPSRQAAPSLNPTPGALSTAGRQSSVHWQQIVDFAASTMQVYRLLRSMHLDACHLLESGTRGDGKPVNGETGRFSIVACEDPRSRERYEYIASSSSLKHIKQSTATSTSGTMKDLWALLQAEICEQRITLRGPAITPFWGGFVGFASYEACLESISVNSSPSEDTRPDAIFVFCARSVVIDHVAQCAYVQTISVNDRTWADGIVSALTAINSRVRHDNADMMQRIDSGVWLRRESAHNIISQPLASGYAKKIAACKEQILSGNSYELCLTAQTSVARSLQGRTRDEESLELYERLRSHNPAPFGAFLQFVTETHHLRVISTSPERFMSWTRSGKVQFRPIKGTVRKEGGTTRAHAECILSSPKEMAENLMIADLIRHDLHGVVGPGKVCVAKLMSVEEYETVFQLVSVIEGQLPSDGGKTGLDALVAALPPGSMTGAPKRRSCEILQDIESGVKRGLYSGILGYIDIAGGGDFSVVIRTAVSCETRSEEQDEDSPFSTWTIGAGGAITSQSTVEGEWDEMLTKRTALLGTFLSG